MATKDPEANRISPQKLQKAKTSLTAITQMKGYAPQRKEFSMENATEILALMDAAQKAELAANNAADKARDAATKAEWAAYNFELTAAEQVRGQYGIDSDEYASLGYKKKSEYKKGGAGGRKKKE